MSFAIPHGSVLVGAMLDRQCWAAPGISYRPSGTRPSRAESRLRIQSNMTVDPVRGLPATSIAAAVPRKLHKREVITGARPPPFPGCTQNPARFARGLGLTRGRSGALR